MSYDVGNVSAACSSAPSTTFGLRAAAVCRARMSRIVSPSFSSPRRSAENISSRFAALTSTFYGATSFSRLQLSRPSYSRLQLSRLFPDSLVEHKPNLTMFSRAIFSKPDALPSFLSHSLCHSHTSSFFISWDKCNYQIFQILVTKANWRIRVFSVGLTMGVSSIAIVESHVDQRTGWTAI